MPHDGTHQFTIVKQNMYQKIYFTIEMQPNTFFKVISCSLHVYAFTGCNLRVGKFDVPASNMIIFWRQYFTKFSLMVSGDA